MTGFFLMDMAASIPYDMIIFLSNGDIATGTDATKARASCGWIPGALPPSIRM